jgi:ABC-type sugar transport system ATPase subunit
VPDPASSSPSPASSSQAPVVELRLVSKRYGSVQAVANVSVSIGAGEIVGLVGKNGAGKSTLIKIMAGATRPDAGEILIGGTPATLRRPHDATELGLAFVHQELALVPAMSVAENVWLGLGYPRRRGLITRRRLHAKTAELTRRLGASIAPDAPASSLTMPERRLVMIARGLAADARLLVLDEPTAAMSQREIDHLHDLVRSLAAAGVAVLYVSHRVDEILALTHRVDVMRDGALAETSATSGLDRADLIDAISGRPARSATGDSPLPALARPAAGRQPTAAAGAAGSRRVLLRVDNLSGPPMVRDASLVLHAGEVLGIGGLVGAGRTELARLLFGCERPVSGSIVLDGKAVQFRSVGAALRSGLVLVPEDRRTQGSVQDFSIARNISLPNLPRIRISPRAPVPSRRREAAVADRLISQLGIVARGPDQEVGALSGGNQQKVILGKWLEHGGRVFIFDEPTTGVDVAAKQEIYGLIRNLAGEERGVIVISSDLQELAQYCDRVVVMREGRTVASLSQPGITEADILRWCYAATPEPA